MTESPVPMCAQWILREEQADEHEVSFDSFEQHICIQTTTEQMDKSSLF